MEDIRKDIVSGKFRKNEKIPAEPELMERYKVGRSTIREAIKTLAISGILRVQQGSGTFVSSKIKNESLNQRLRRADFDELNHVRTLLELEIVNLACIHAVPEDIEHMNSLLVERKKATDSGNFKKAAEADIAFHVHIAQASGNLVLKDLYQNFSRVLQDFFQKREDSIEHFAHTQATHEELSAAIALKDQKLAEQLLKTILQNNY